MFTGRKFQNAIMFSISRTVPMRRSELVSSHQAGIPVNQ